MTTKEAIKILEEHNEWRRGAETEMLNPTQIGLAIDVLLTEAKKNLKYNCSMCGTEFDYEVGNCSTCLTIISMG
jgi:hypothetical protein